MAEIAYDDMLTVNPAEALETAVFDFPQLLKDQSVSRDLSKGERTRAKILYGASQVLAATPVVNLRVAHICRAANVSYGLFYRYFKDKDELIYELSKDFLSRFIERYRSIHSTDDKYADIFVGCYLYIDSFDRNPGLMRAVFQGAQHSPELKRETEKVLNAWHARVAKSSPKSIAGEPLSQDEQVLVAHLVGGMLDSVMLQVFIHENSDLQHWGTSHARLAEICAMIWFRAIYGDDPDMKSVRRVRRHMRKHAVV
jgi:AcrR family transcriptional regulator